MAASWLAQWLTFVRAPARLLPFIAGAAVFVLSIVPGFQGRRYRTLRPEVRDLPLHLDNYSEYQRLLADLDAWLGKNGKLVVYSYGMAIFGFIGIRLNPAIIPHISYLSYFLAAELFRFDNLRADYALVRSDDLRRHPGGLERDRSWRDDPDENGIGRGMEKVGLPHPRVKQRNSSVAPVR